MKSLKDVKAQLLANPAVRQAYDAQAPEFELARELITNLNRLSLASSFLANSCPSAIIPGTATNQPCMDEFSKRSALSFP